MTECGWTVTVRVLALAFAFIMGMAWGAGLMCGRQK